MNKLEASVLQEEDMEEVSDGYHTFNQLYHQRAVLFATIVNQNKDKAWKSWKHEDGKFCFDKDGEWFIVGIDTPEGSYTYHYEQKYWDMFNCEELDRGKHWDGHTEENVTRLLSLPPVTPTEKQDHGRLIDADKLLQDLFIVDEEEWTTPEIRAILENAPTVITPTERTGEWIDRDGWSYCSNCGGKATPQNNGCEIEPCRTLFCQWCGAKMKGGE